MCPSFNDIVSPIITLLDALWPQTCLACEQLAGASGFCEDCQGFVQRLESEAVFAFSGPIQTVIQQAKFMPHETKARRLMRAVTSKGFEDRDAITFIPIHWRRRIKRGFDLSAIFALTLGKQLRLPVWDLLANTRYDTPLTLSKSREERLKLTRGRYKIRQESPPSRLLLVDDVTTTGATLDAGREVLEAAGHQVSLYALAKTPILSESK
jgi:predicted amidophosphoribosyltransferase